MEGTRLAVGTVIKPHGIKGELNVIMTDSAEVEDFAPGACLFIEIEGLDVPFFIGSMRSRGADSLLITLDEITDEKQAADLTGKTLYVFVDPSELDDDEEMTVGALIGYQVIDASSGETVGHIADVRELTPGCWYFFMEESEKLLPAVDEMILEVDPENRCVLMDLPEGLAEL